MTFLGKMIGPPVENDHFVKYSDIAYCYFVVKSVRFSCSDSVKGIIGVDHYGAVEDEMCRTLSQAVGTQRAMSRRNAYHCNKETVQR